MAAELVAKHFPSLPAKPTHNENRASGRKPNSCPPIWHRRNTAISCTHCLFSTAVAGSTTITIAAITAIALQSAGNSQRVANNVKKHANATASIRCNRYRKGFFTDD